MKKRMSLYKLIVVVSLITVVFSLTSVVSAKNAGDESYNNSVANLDYNPRAEQWIIQQLNAGNAADLAKKFPDLADRRIRASFLVNLLDYPTQSIILYGISISDATIVGDLVLKYRDINFPVLIKWSTFEGVVELCSTRFHRYLSLQGSTFKSRVDFCELKVDDDVCLSAATFNDSLDFGAAHISGNLIFENARFSNEKSKAGFSSIEVDKSLFLNHAIFAGEAVIDFAKIGRDLQLDGAQFKNSQSTASFAVTQVGRVLAVSNAVFAGGADFQRVQAGSLTANDVVFQNAEQTANFEGFHTESIFLMRTIFNGPARFYGTQLSGHFIAIEAKFLNTESDVDFENMVVGQSLDLSSTVFNGPVNFTNVNVGTYFIVNHSQFNNDSKSVVFGRSKVGNILFLKQTVFAGPVNLSYMEIGSLIEATEARFNSEEGSVTFASSSIEDSFILNKAIFAGSADFQYVRIGTNFEAQDTQFNHPTEYADFNNMQVGEYIFLHRAVLVGPVNFYHARTKGLYANDVTWPRGMIDLRGFIYDELEIYTDKPGDWPMLDLIWQSPYDAQPYYVLQNYYVSHGYPEAADTVYVSYKIRETRDGLNITAWKWWWNLFLGGFILFGKGPELALIWFALIVGFGYLMFRKKEKMVTVIETTKRYRPFLYSIDLFLPIINLGYVNLWVPNPEKKIIHIYAIIHRYLGLILIPVAILAFLGVIK